MTNPSADEAFDYTVLQVIPSLESGGAERTTVEVAKAIVDAGGKAFVASAGGRLVDETIAAGARHIELPVQSKNPFTLWANAAALEKIIEAEGIDVIHARSRAPAWSSLWAARRTGAKFVTTYHGAYKQGGPVKRLYNSSMTRSDLVIANSDFTARRIRSHHAIDEARLQVIARGADLSVFSPEFVSVDRRTRLREEWELAEDDQVLLLPARLTDWKGHNVAIRALASLVRREQGEARSLDKNSSRHAGQHTRLKLVFAGDSRGRDAYVAALKSEARDNGVLSMIKFVGHCADMPSAYANADIVLAPSTRPEAFGRTAVEAGAMERVVVASDHGGAAETLVNGETGYLTLPGDAEALADKLIALQDTPIAGRLAMGAKARARVETHYSIEVMTTRTLDAYRGLLAAADEKGGLV